MIIDRDENITLITQETAKIPQLVEKIQQSYEKFKNDNIIVNLSSLGKLKLEDIIEFLEVSNKHRKAKHSFVIVASDFNFDDAPDEIVIVPTTQEAYDIIEMEEMERDLGF
ncbi:MAG: ribonuclease Z [Mangrovimonas sp.]|nr:ribonuclease Z [Mangrovimonas sp.]MCB0427637.1 ribonuclease Z [Mangrovimonas sp.]HPF98238.1 ribonuclease Z [Mangrovimonas sp.]